MSVYRYIAEINPDAAYEVCQRNGFGDIYSNQELSDTLQVIAAQGENGLKDVLSAHPDREVIIEVYLSENNKSNSVNYARPLILQKNFANANGSTNLVSKTNAYILVGAIIVSLAIVSTIKQ
jgi:hypothetical protein